MHANKLLWLLFICGWIGCRTPDQQVGSICPKGNCLLAEPNDGLVCLTTRELMDLDPANSDECLPRAIPVGADGLVACRLMWRVIDDPTATIERLGVTGCMEPPFVDETGRRADPVSCDMRQLSAEEATAGDEQGWTYSDDEGCPRVRYSAGVPPAQPGVTAQLDCEMPLARQGEALIDVHPSQCAGPSANPNANLVGASCLPTMIPDGGFHIREAYFEAPHAQCGSGPCLAFKLEGDPSPQCSGPTCSTAENIEKNLYCSCRCAAGEGDPSPECECPDNYSCVELLGRDYENDRRGGYCVKNTKDSP